MNNTLTILITGGTGLIGNYLTEYLKDKGYSVRILSRNKRSLSDEVFYWNPLKKEIDLTSLSGVDVVINLAGAGIGDKIWTRKRKKIIYSSRIESTRLLVDTILEKNIKIKMWINASAIGYYGHKPGEMLNENSYAGEDFLSKLCVDWEQETYRILQRKISLAILRLGVVLSTKDGGLPKFLLPVHLGFNILFGKTQIFLNWIHIADLLMIFEALLKREIKPGIYNAVTPNPVTLKVFNKELAKIIGKKTIKIRIPNFVFKLLPGGMNIIFTNEQYIVPAGLKSEHFNYYFPEINPALNNLLA
ncbi:MAG: TIGR01777 family oxidoreductase [Bacteroidales bacterium]|nr:TIGR01777 family oxidoreductase [Bacteroidales bacterium]